MVGRSVRKLENHCPKYTGWAMMDAVPSWETPANLDIVLPLLSSSEWLISEKICVTHAGKWTLCQRTVHFLREKNFYVLVAFPKSSSQELLTWAEMVCFNIFLPNWSLSTFIHRCGIAWSPATRDLCASVPLDCCVPGFGMPVKCLNMISWSY